MTRTWKSRISHYLQAVVLPLASTTPSSIPPRSRNQSSQPSLSSAAWTWIFLPFIYQSVSEVPRTINSLPGRNIRPTARKSLGGNLAVDNMGGFLSKVEGLKAKLSRAGKEGHSRGRGFWTKRIKQRRRVTESILNINVPAAKARPPSPEYAQGEVKTPVVEQVVSPSHPIVPRISTSSQTTGTKLLRRFVI